MKTNLFFSSLVLLGGFGIQAASAQPLTGYSFKVVNMMPNAQSNETNFDSETNIAVDPSNTLSITGSAFTPNASGSSTSAPIYVSTDGGTSWALKNIVPSGNGMTGDITLGFAGSTGNLYAGILRGGSSFRCMLLRTTNPSGGALMTTLIDRSTESVDQPWVSATTVNDASATPRDRIFAGDNRFGGRLSAGGNGKTAEVMVSNDGASAPPSGFATRVAEVRSTFEEDFPAIRTAIHSSGVVYGIFYSWQSGNPISEKCDVVVVRDDNFASGATQFKDLSDAGDTKAGQRVVTNRTVPAFGISLGNNRLVGSNLAIAVDPNNSANVFIAWCDRVGSTDYTIHFRRSTNSGQAWGSSDWLTITNATNPGIAVTTDGKVGLMYQQFTGSGSTARWETHFRFTTVSGSTFTDDILSTFLDNDLATSPISPSLGDYLRIQAVGKSFYGVFPASNRPVSSNFPHLVTYLRNANFGTNNLRNLSNTANVNVSVDPFFFRISPQLIFNFCVLHPDICKLIVVKFPILEFPPYPCRDCPWPCLSCPPFEIPIEEIYQEVFKDTKIQTELSIPYFHLFLDGYDPKTYDIKIVTSEGEPVAQKLNRTEKGYAISFLPSKKNFTINSGMRGLKLIATPLTTEAAQKAARFNFRMEASDYQFKEFIAQKK
jgi:hypothetical protein